MKKIITFFLLLILSTNLFACSKNNSSNSVNDNDKELFLQNIPLINQATEYALEYNYIPTYFYKNGNIPMIDINKFVRSLKGFINVDKMTYSLNKEENQITQQWISNNYTYMLTANWQLDTIYVNDMGFFKNTEEQEGIDYIRNGKWEDCYSSQKKPVNFNIGNYYFDILFYNDLVLIPLPILNVLFCSTNQTNILYNGEEYHFYYSTPPSDIAKKMRESSLNGTFCPNDIRQASINGLLFTMDYFYGLNDYKDIDSFKNYIGEKLLNNLWNNSSNVFNNAYINIFQKKLDELHTNLIYPSVYNELEDKFDIYNESNIGERWEDYYTSLAQLEEKYSQIFNNEKLVRFEGNTAFIKFNSFDVAPTGILYESNGSISEEAWKYDTFFMMLKAMQEIQLNTSTHNIVIDLTTNGGGSLGAMYQALGFLTNKNIELPCYNTLTNEFRKDYYSIDSDNDFSYDDNDAYTNYKWFILTSKNTFSAANCFTSVAKNMGIATIIGEKSGGGMCSVMPCSLLDGTIYRISSNNSLRYAYFEAETNKTIYNEIESGIKPNYEINRDDFYNLEFLDNFLNSIKK